MVSQAFEEIAENFELFDDWEDRYRYVIELGKEMEALPDVYRVDAYKVDGCASQVWLVPEIEGEGAGRRLTFAGDSDAMIVRGLIALLHKLYSGQPLSEVGKIDAEGAFACLGLDQALSAQRSNGVRAMVARIREIASTAPAQ